MSMFDSLKRRRGGLLVFVLCGLAGFGAARLMQYETARRSASRDQKTRAALERHWSDIEDQDRVQEIYHDDVLVEFTQSGERFLGVANLRGMRENYPARVAAAIRRSRGGGDLWVTELVLTYDGEKRVNAVSVMEFRGDKVARESLYFGDPWEPPAWRARWVEQTK